MTENERLLAVVAPVFEALRKAGLAPILVGGLAVFLRRHQTSMAIDIRLPASLASMVRVTGDVDIAFAFSPEAESRAAAVLQQNGLARTNPGRNTFAGNGIRVDMLACIDDWTKDTSFRIAKDRTARPVSRKYVVSETVGGAIAIDVSDRAMLVLHKAIAWCDRFAPKDLADIAGLALTDQVEDGTATADLSALVASLHGEYGRMLERVACEFANADRPGPLAFAVTVRDILMSQSMRVSDDEEDMIREIASIGARQLLEPWC